MQSMPFVRCVGIGTAIRQNCLKKAYDWRMLCILQGDGTLELEGRMLHTQPNQMYLIRPGTAYRVFASDAQRIAVINFDTTSEYAHLREPVLSVDAAAFCPEKILPSAPLPFWTDFVCEASSGELALCEELYRLYLRGDLEKDVKQYLLSAKLAYLFTCVLPTAKKPDLVSSQIYRYILEHASEKLTAEGVARHFNYSPSYVEKLLRRHYGTSFRQLILETRLQNALWLLENTSDSCVQIAAALGFYSSQHFTQAFKKRFGRTPSQLR